MATEGGGKMKNKRHKDPDTPYNRRRSIIGHVTDTVKGMIGSSSWLTNLVNSVKKSPPKKDDIRDREHDGGKHMGMVGNSKTLPSQGGSFLMTPGRDVAPNIDIMNYTPPHMPFPQYMQMPQHIMVNGGERRTDYPGTPAFSPVLNPDTGEYQHNMLNLNDSRLQQLRQEFQQQNNPHSASPPDLSMTHDHSKLQGETTMAADESSFLWSTKPKRQASSQPQVPSKITKASFNASAFGASSNADKYIFGGGLHGQSPFYPGKTMFGGAAAHRKVIPSSQPYQLPSRKVTTKPLNNSSIGGVTSSAAKRILETLEKMSSPLADARKMPTADPSTSLLITPVRRRTIERPQVKEGPPLQQLNPLGFASIAPNTSALSRAGLNTKQPQPENKEEQNNNSLQKSQPFNKAPVSYSDTVPSRGSGKMRREKGSHHYSSKTVIEDEQVEVPDLPTNFTLPLAGSLPKFNFMSTAPQTSAPSTAPANSSIQSSSSKVSESSTLSPAAPGADFKFSSPIAKAVPAAIQTTSPKKSFEFSSPIKVDQASSLSKPAPSLSSSITFGPMSNNPNPGLVMNFGQHNSTSALKRRANVPLVTENDTEGFKPAKELKQGSVMDILGKSSGGIQPATELKPGSVMDVLKSSTSSGFGNATYNATTSSTSTSGFGTLFGKPVGSWECSTCMVQNKADLTKCAACETPKPGSKPVPALPSVPASTTSQTGSGFGMMFSKPSGSWECSTCMVQNKSDAVKCAACETPKPGAKPTASMPSVPASGSSSSSGFGAMFSKPTGSWECATCMVQNKSDAAKCAACETPKPGAKPVPSMPSVPASGNSTSAGFGMMFSKPSGSWECATCMVQNKSDATKCAACETPKSGAKPAPSMPSVPAIGGSSTSSGFGMMFSKPSGSWECSTCMVQNKSDATKCAACETPKPGAKPAPSLPSVPASTAFSGFGNLAKSTSWECNTCLVHNKAELTKCIACETPKPGAKPTTGFTSPGGFKFGASGGLQLPTGSTSSSSHTSFGSGTFNVTSTSTAANFGSGSFNVTSTSTAANFGSASFNATTPAAATPVTGGLKFGASNDSDMNEVPKTNGENTPVGGFKFGTVSAPKSESSTTPNSEAPESKPSVGGFQFGKTGGSPAIGGFHFSTDNTKSHTSDNIAAAVSTASTGGFSFGLSKPSTPSTVAPSLSVGVSKDSKDSSSTFTPTGLNTDSSNAVKTEPNKTPTSLFTIKDSKPTNTDSSKTSTPLFSSPFSSSGIQFGSNNQVDKGFSFGSSQSSSTSNSETLGKRTRDDAEEGSSAKKATFSFGGAATSSTPAAPFKFGETATEPTFKFGQSNLPAGTTSSPFTFSASTSNTNTSGSGILGKPAGSGGLFGSASTPNLGSTSVTPTPFAPQNTGFASSSSLFGNGPSPASSMTPQSGGLFGGPVSTAPAFNPTPATTAANTGFQFGNTATKTPGLFEFSAGPAKPQGNAVGGNTNGGTFIFGQTQPQAAAPAGAPGGPVAPFSFSASPAFNFGGAPSSSAPVQFSAGGSTENKNNPFSIAGGQSRRPVKKAFRKLKK